MGSLCACGTNKEDKEHGSSGVTDAVTQEQEETDPYKTLDNPDMTFGGDTFRVMSIAHDSLYTALDVGGITGESVNDAIYERNRLIEQIYDIRFECDTDLWINTWGYLERQVQSGDSSETAYDLIMLICRNAYAATMNNYLRDYDDLEYIDLDKEYYFKDLNSQFSMGNKTFFAYGAESINALGQANCLVFNKKMVTDNNFGNLYDMVNQHTWTYDAMFTMATNVLDDRNGDGKYVLGEDVLGFIGDYDLTIPAAWVSAGTPLIAKDEDDNPFYYAEGNRHFLDVFQMALDQFASNSCAVFTSGDDKEEIFSSGKALFYCGVVCHLATIKSMDSDYGVVPFPMFDESQSQYYSRLVDGWIHCVPATCRDTVKTSIIMQALAYYSYRTVYDAYYSHALTAKYLRDKESVDMLKLILSTLTVDLGDTVWYEKVRSPLVRRIVDDKGKTAMRSTLKSYHRVIRTLCEDTANFALGKKN